MKKLRPYALGLLQALGVIIYCGLVSGLVWYLGEYHEDPPQFFAITFVLILLVFSAAVTGTIVFGIPALLALKGKIKRALSIVGYTLLFLLLAVAVILTSILFL